MMNKEFEKFMKIKNDAVAEGVAKLTAALVFSDTEADNEAVKELGKNHHVVAILELVRAYIETNTDIQCCGPYYVPYDGMPCFMYGDCGNERCKFNKENS